MSGEPTTSDGGDRTLTHEALLYRSQPQLEGAVRDFLQVAAIAQEPVLAALPGSNVEWLHGALGNAAKSVRFEDMNVVGRNPNRLLPMIEEWVDDHAGRARVITEPVWPGRSYPETIECLRHEAILNHALAWSAATILCPYDAERLDADTLAGAELTHPSLIEDGGLRRRSERYGDPLQIHAAEQWPLEAPVAPISEHHLQGSLHALRRAVADDPVVRALARRRRDDLVFAINEAATNTVRHGDGTCTARIWHDGHSVVTEVSFETTVADVLAGRRRPRADGDSGRGLWLINQVCDLVELRSGTAGTTLRMHVRD